MSANQHLHSEGNLGEKQTQTTGLEFTGERFVPEIRGNIELEHLHRYLLATQIAAEKVVLDIASGEGYGSAMLAEKADRVIGVDISLDTVNHANNRYRRKNLEFMVGTCVEIPIPDASVDLVVSFETIEHIQEHDQMLQEIKRVLRPGGVLLISSPDKYYYAVEPGYNNPYHKKELYDHEFRQLVGTYFKNQQYYGQRVILGSTVLTDASPTPTLSFYKENNFIKSQSGLIKPIYRIALASDSTLPELASSILEQPVIESEIVRIWSNTVAERDLNIKSLTAQAESLATQVESLDAQLHQRNLQVESLNVQLDRRNGQVESLEILLDQSNAQVSALTARAAKQKALARSLSARLDEKEGENQVLSGELSLSQDEAAAYALSRSWRITRPIRKKLRYAKVVWAYLKHARSYLSIRRSGLFDDHFYLKSNPDVRQADMDPLLHFVQDGWKDGRSPSPAFDLGVYLSMYPDVKASGMNPFLHYLRHGKKEGRFSHISISGDQNRQNAQQMSPESDAAGVWLDEDALETISDLYR